MADHTPPSRYSYASFEGLRPGMVGREDSKRLLTYLQTKKMITEKYLARHFLGIQEALEQGELDNVFW